MSQDRKRDQGMPSRQSNMDEVEGSRGNSGSERGRGSDRERNRPLDRERRDSEQVPDHGESQSER